MRQIAGAPWLPFFAGLGSAGSRAVTAVLVPHPVWFQLVLKFESRSVEIFLCKNL
ncbi:MAG: hypothetical protein EDM05_000355 (plasmid) [Leptolyngbya sp. IPPAS B-1204]